MSRGIFILGFFDAIHIGHRLLINEGLRFAKKNSEELFVVTFADQLYEELHLNLKEIYLLSERQAIIDNLGSKSIVLPTNSEFLAKSDIEFLHILKDMNPSTIIVGNDYTFGKNARGNSEKLKSFFDNTQIEVIIINLLNDNDEKISTSFIRKLLQNGNIKRANSLLGSPFFVSGEVVGGLHNGHLIGFPTANINFSKYKIIPKYGVYATFTYIDGVKYPSVSNVGAHPTFDNSIVNLETHILNFTGDLYGKTITVEFIEYLREIEKFDSISQLKDQIGADVELAKKELLYD